MALRSLPVGDAAELRLSHTTDGAQGAGVWVSAVVGARWIADFGAPVFAGRSVLEIGCGTGALGLATLAQGPARLVLSDYDEECLASARANAERNQHLSPGTEVRVEALDWDALDASAVEPGSFDVVVGADILYEGMSAAPALFDGIATESDSDSERPEQSAQDVRYFDNNANVARVLAAMLAPDGEAHLFVRDDRGESLDVFCAAAEAAGLALTRDRPAQGFVTDVWGTCWDDETAGVYWHVVLRRGPGGS